ncbi:MAG: hypothetical protein JXM70_03655 [Pirellulales bacterium]|nr:hypothetical protein [Pirellulales bacterium]
MQTIIDIVSGIDQSIARNFQFDYIICDFVFLVIFISLMIWQKRYGPLAAGAVCGVIIYIIDGVVWYTLGVREYGISDAWMKHPVDFMMDFSYGVVAFGWMWVAFERKSVKDVVFWTALVLGGWFLVPFASSMLHLHDEPIMTVRHMQSQVGMQIGMVVAGYALLAILRYDFKMIAYLFWVGSMLGFMMEIPLNVFNIRPTGIDVLVYETLFLFNMGVPYLFIVFDKIIPVVRRRMMVCTE